MAKLLYIEDDAALAECVEEVLSQEGHNVEIAYSGEDSLQLLASYHYDLILIDWELPGISGIEVCKNYRKTEGNSWILFLTGRGSEANIEEGLDAGADDYLTKPFSMNELRARIRSAMRRLTGAYQAELCIDGLSLDIGERSLHSGDNKVRLTPREVALLEFLMRNPNKHFSSSKLLAAVWPSDTDTSEGTVRTYMSFLRQKLSSIGRPNFVLTEAGLGYSVKK